MGKYIISVSAVSKMTVLVAKSAVREKAKCLVAYEVLPLLHCKLDYTTCKAVNVKWE